MASQSSYIHERTTTMNAMYNVIEELGKLRKTLSSIMDKHQASNRLFYIGKLGRQLRNMKNEVGLGTLDGVPDMAELYPQLDPLEKLHVSIMLKGYKNAKDDCERLSKELQVLETWWETRGMMRSQGMPIPKAPSVVELVPRVQDDSKSGLYSVPEDELEPEQVAPQPVKDYTLAEILKRASAKKNA